MSYFGRTSPREAVERKREWSERLSLAVSSVLEGINGEKLSVREAAERYSVSRPTVTRWEEEDGACGRLRGSVMEVETG